MIFRELFGFLFWPPIKIFSREFLEYLLTTFLTPYIYDQMIHLQPPPTHTPTKPSRHIDAIDDSIEAVEAVSLHDSYIPPPVNVRLKRLCGSQTSVVVDSLLVTFVFLLPFIIYYLVITF